MKTKDTPKKINDTTYEVKATEALVEYGDKEKINLEPTVKIKKLDKEIKRAKAIAEVADKIVQSAKVQLDYAKVVSEITPVAKIPMLEAKTTEEDKTTEQ